MLFDGMGLLGSYNKMPPGLFKGHSPKRDPWNRGGSLGHYRGWHKPQPEKTKRQSMIAKQKRVREILARKAG